MVLASRLLTERSGRQNLGIEWEETPCLLCGHEQGNLVLEGADNARPEWELRFAVVECPRCGLCYTNPRPTFDSIGQFYTIENRPQRTPRLITSHVNRPAKIFSRLIGRPCRERHRLPWHGQGRLLDLGYGDSRFLLRMHNQGWKVVGIDLSKNVTQRLRKDYGFNTYTGNLPHPDLQRGSFDVVTMWASIEHSHHPLSTLREVFNLLTPHGRLYLQVPNNLSWNRQLFNQHSDVLDLPRRLTHFSKVTLRKMLETSGFHVKWMRQISQPTCTIRSLRIARKAGEEMLLKRLLAFKPVNLVYSWLAYLCGGSDNIFALAERPK